MGKECFFEEKSSRACEGVMVTVTLLHTGGHSIVNCTHV